MTQKEKPSPIQVEVSPLVEADIDQFDPILEAHVWDRSTGQVITDEVELVLT